MKFDMDTEFDGAKITLEVDLGDPSLEKVDGQIKVNVPEDYETRYKIQNIKYGRKLSRLMRSFAMKLIDTIDANDKRSA